MMQFSAKNKLWLLGLLSAAIYGVNFHIGDLLVHVRIIQFLPQPISLYLIQIVPLGLIYLCAIWLPPRMEENSKNLALILLFALLFRLPLIPLDSALSSDIYRYVWEGKIQARAGINPYVHPPLDDRLVVLRDEKIYPFINRKESPTVYPAGAQLLFALAHRAGVDTPQRLKSVALIADALTVVLLLLILRQLQLPLSRVIIYAWNPLLIYELFYSGHLESFMLPPLLGFIYLFLRGWLVGAGVALGLATAIKLVPAFLLATLAPGKRLKVAIPLVFTVGFAYLFYASAGTRILGFLPTYFSDPNEIFNLGIFQLALLWITRVLSFPALWIRFVLFAFLFAILVVISRVRRTSPVDIIRGSYVVLSSYLLLIYPAFHPWYLCTLIPFLCVIPSRAWILFSLLLPLSYFKYLTADGTMPAWITLAQFIPLYGLLIWEHSKSGIAFTQSHPADRKTTLLNRNRKILSDNPTGDSPFLPS